MLVRLLLSGACNRLKFLCVIKVDVVRLILPWFARGKGNVNTVSVSTSSASLTFPISGTCGGWDSFVMMGNVFMQPSYGSIQRTRAPDSGSMCISGGISCSVSGGRKICFTEFQIAPPNLPIIAL
jgi:hypothetical protein